MNHRPPFFSAQRPLASALAALMVCSSTLTPVAPAYAQKAAKRARDDQAMVTLNFVNAEIDGVARAMGAILKRQFIVDPRVKGTITLYSEEAMPPAQAYNQFLAALRGQGVTVVESSGLYKVVPEADAKLQTNTVSVGPSARQGDQVVTQIFKINHENANNLVPVLRPLISPNNTINANPGNNTLVITDYADNLQRLAKIISAMDTASNGDVEVITLKYAVASDIAPLVQRLTDSSGGATPGFGGGIPPGLPGSLTGGSSASILVDPRSNSLLVRAPNPARLASIRAVVDKLDKPIPSAAGSTGNVWVVYLKNADAVKLAAVLRAAYPNAGNSAGGAGGGGGGFSPGSLTPPNSMANLGNATNGASPQATAPVTASAGPSTGGFIQADPSSNALIITAPEPTYRQLRSVIDQLDSRRAQVYVESLIVEVDADKSADLGIQWQGITSSSSGNNVLAGGSNFGSGSGNILNATATIANGVSNLGTKAADLATAITGIPGGLNIGLAHKFGKYYTLGAMANALNTMGGTNILSTPNLVTLDNEEAKIVVGKNVAFTSSKSFTPGTTSPFNTVERKDVGITLRLKPQIGENGTVRMTIFQESSDLAGESKNGEPITTKRSIESTVVVDDGQPIVLGGLIDDKYSGNVSKVPLLGDIPYVGALFRSEGRTHRKTNLMIFLRPVVMRDQASSTNLSLDRYDYMRREQEKAQPNYNGIMRVNEAPVLPPIDRPAQPPSPPASAPLPQAPAATEPASAPTEPSGSH